MEHVKRLGDRRLIIATDMSVRNAEERWITPTLRYWPDHLETPKVQRVGLYELRSMLDETKPHDRGLGARDSLAAGVLDPVADAVLIIVGPGYPSTHLYQIADHLDRTITPAVVVITDREPVEHARLARGVLQHHGVLVESDKVSPGHLSSALGALMLRQPALERLASELRLGQLSQQQIHDELDRVHIELHKAATLQHEFVRCAAPYTPDVDFGVIYRPATYVSGDIFDIEQLDEHHIGIFLADAVGHGVPAGMLTLFISRSLPKIDGFAGAARVVPPSEALARLNHAYCGRAQGQSRFATAVYGVLNTRTMQMRMATAGHPAPLIVAPNGDVSRPTSDGPLLGVFPDGLFNEVTVDLSDGSRAVFFSDGFEVASPSEGPGAFDVSLASRRHETELANLALAADDREGLAHAVTAMQAKLDTQIGSLHQADDVTAVVIAPRVQPAKGRVAA
ncbi:MAG: hypothetical protein CMJ31_03520 [Phycisphaerae bacterium]|nr:hypothetical protein [Phycisphaerae bacterium]